MNEPNEKPPRYKWPWFVLAAVVVFVLLAILWVSFAIRAVERERSANPPAPATAK